jgi:hypothetical protein
MPGRSVTAALIVSLIAGGCTTTTAHRLVVLDNPLREQAIACEAKCRAAAGLAAKADCPPFGGDRCNDGPGSVADPDRYAACLDACPGTTAVDGASCPHPDPGAFCVETTKANAGGIIGGTFAVIGIAVAVAALWLLLAFARIFGSG